jgi:hypothetical protein
MDRAIQDPCSTDTTATEMVTTPAVAAVRGTVRGDLRRSERSRRRT